MTPSQHPKLAASFELIDLIHERSMLLKRIMAQEPGLGEDLRIVNDELVEFEN